MTSRLVSSLSLLALLTSACGFQSPSSAPEATTVVHTPIEKQTIGNCWSYATIALIESVLLSESNGGNGVATANGSMLPLRSQGKVTLNLSEGYLMLRHYEQQLRLMKEKFRATGRMNPGDIIDGARTWSLMLGLVERHGVMFESDFHGDPSLNTDDQIMKAAGAIQDALRDSGSALSRAVRGEQGGADPILDELKKMFVTNLSAAKIFRLQDVKSARASRSVWDVVGKYTSVSFPSMAGAPTTTLVASRNAARDFSPVRATEVSSERQALQRRVMRALNDGLPVGIAFFVDKAYLSKSGVFSLSTTPADSVGLTGQGDHLVVAVDYTAKVASQVVGEGPVAEPLKAQAAQSGELTSLIVKNSWGTEYTRLDIRLGRRVPITNFYLYQGQGGYFRLDSDYLHGWSPELAGERIKWFRQLLNDVILPAGY